MHHNRPHDNLTWWCCMPLLMSVWGRQINVVKALERTTRRLIIARGSAPLGPGFERALGQPFPARHSILELLRFSEPITRSSPSPPLSPSWPALEPRQAKSLSHR